MKIIKRILLGILALILLVAIGLFIYLQSQKPVYSGEIILEGLTNEVEVLYDDYGVPHIYAQNDEDAYYALGYVHAQDRLFQMEMLRRAAGGRLAEILGPDLLKIDKLFRTLGLNEFAKTNAKEFLGSDTTAYQREALAYQKGINEFIRNGKTPLEFTIIGIPKEEFKPEDIYLAIGFMSFGFAEGIRVDPILEKINETFGTDYLQDFYPDSASIERIRNFKNDSIRTSPDQLISAINEALALIPVPMLEGSNGWVVSPEKSKTGAPILANDTHIGFGQPAVWYEAYIEYPGFRFYGHHIAGIPFGLLGTNQRGGWGLTMFENDETDFFVEELNPQNKNEVKFKGQWEPLSLRQEIIKVKGKEDVVLDVQSSRHGPIINQIVDEVNNESAPVSLSWVLTQLPNRALEAAYWLNHSTSLEDTKKAASLFTSPGLNVMYGDVDGNIAWWAVARLPVRPPHVQSKLFLNGASGDDEYLGYYDFSKNPQAINPPWGYVYSSNNQPEPVEGVTYPGYYYPRARAHRIVSLLEGTDKFSAEDMKKINLDVISETAPKVARVIAGELKKLNKDDYLEIISILENWNGDHQKEDIAPSVYYTILSHILYLTIPDEIGDASFHGLLNSSVMKGAYLKFLENESSPWWDNVNTKEVTETRGFIFEKAAKKSVALLKAKFGNKPEDWAWKKMHTLTHNHPLGAVKPLDKVFNVGPYEVPGGIEVLNNLMFTLDTLGHFPVTSGPALRKVTDFNDIESGFTVSPTGQSGNVMSEYYDDEAEMYATGKFRGMLMNRDEIQKKTSGKLLLKPN